jgi:hypothetical protein
MPLLHALSYMIRHARLYHALPGSAVPYAPRRSPPYMAVLARGPLQLAQRTCNAGIIARYTIGKRYRTLSPMRGHPGLI